VKPWETLDRAPSGGGELVLARRGHEFSIRFDGRELMGNRAKDSERALARVPLEALETKAPRVMIGGLGMGFTLREALDVTGPGARIDVVELSPAVVRWNESWLAELAGSPLDDPRVTVVHADVRDVIRRSRAAYDAILLDVDNGPGAFSAPGNASLYGRPGIRAAAAALAPGGVLAIWAASGDAGFAGVLRAEGFEVRVEHPFAHGTRGHRHVVFVAFAGRRSAPVRDAERRGGRSGPARDAERRGGRSGPARDAAKRRRAPRGPR
jgi:spermidine synthase